MKRKIIVPKTISQHIEEEFRKNPEFRKAYDEEVARGLKSKAEHRLYPPRT